MNAAGLLDGGVVGRAFHDVQRPAVAGAGFLGDRQRSGEVVAPPHERSGHGDASQHVGVDRREPEAPIRACSADCTLGVRARSTLYSVNAAHVSAIVATQAVEIERAVLPEPIVAGRVRSAEKPLERVAELRGGLERPQAERVDEDQRAEPRRIGTRERRRDRAAERLADAAPEARCMWHRSAHRATT